MINIFIGYDRNEQIAYHVLSQSILRNATRPVRITPLYQPNIKYEFSRERSEIESTEFSFSRFIVPKLMDYTGWALFMDCDMLMKADISELWAMRDDRYAVQVCKHDYVPKEKTKFLGQVQTIYPRKNWSSFIVFNCSHPSTKNLTVEKVNSETGAYLHQFKWCKDEEIGSLDERWNWLEGWTSNHNDEKPFAVHYTRGGPWFDEWQDVEFASEWINERDEYLKNKFSEV